LKHGLGDDKQFFPFEKNRNARKGRIRIRSTWCKKKGQPCFTGEGTKIWVLFFHFHGRLCMFWTFQILPFKRKYLLFFGTSALEDNRLNDFLTPDFLLPLIRLPI
jgi:hypothetical protein